MLLKDHVLFSRTSQCSNQASLVSTMVMVVLSVHARRSTHVVSHGLLLQLCEGVLSVKEGRQVSNCYGDAVQHVNTQ